MFRVAAWTCLVLVLLVPEVVAAEDGIYIEQEIVMESISGQPTMKGNQKTWYTKDQIRNQISYGEETSVAIIDLAKKRIVLIPSAEKQYIEMNLEDYQRLVAMRLAGTGLNDPEAKPTLTRSGVTKQIGKWQCEKVVFELKGEMTITSEMWIAEDAGIDFGAYLELLKNLGMEKALGRLSGFVTSLEGYPIEVQTEQVQNGQKVMSSHRVTRIEKGPVDQELFMIPNGYEPIQDKRLTVVPVRKGEK